MTAKLVVGIRLPLLQAAVRNWLATTGDFEVSGQASTGPEAIALVEETRADILLLDVELPGVGDFEAIRTIAERFPDLRIVVLSEEEDRETIVDAVRMGAAGYLAMTWGARDLIKILRAVAAGRRLRLRDLSYQPASTGNVKPRAG
jgi:DNA-binding NarL/FixJ family response regulator